jgi:glycosyltransferase involved in cell wall biosynthesis
MISIVIPVYREQTYLPRTLKALTSQTIIKDCEIILAEYNPDYSTYTREVAKEFYEKYKIPIFIKDVFSAGIAHARNEGVVASRGQYFVNFDADARFNKTDALERMVAPLIALSSWYSIMFTRSVPSFRKRCR